MKKNKFILFILICLICSVTLNAQVKEAVPSPETIHNNWKAKWITHNDGSMYDYGVHHFRKTFGLVSQPQSFVINVSGDQRYQLFVNGELVCIGPSRGNLGHWYYETIDIAPFLTAGTNLLAATVWHCGEWTHGAQISLHTGFIVQGNSSAEEIVNTNSSWKVYTNPSYTPNLQQRQDVGPGENIDGSLYPWDWNSLSFNDKDWQAAKEIRNGQPYGNGTEYTWALIQRDIPFMEESEIKLSSIRRSSGAEITDAFLKGERNFTVPANSKATILFDQGHLTTAYPELFVSGGKGSSIKLSYAEALVDKNNTNGNRNEIEVKELI